MNDRLQALLAGDQPPGIYRLDSRARPATLCSQAERAGWRCFRLDGRRIASKAGFLRACAEAMRFPAYFGHNWDALEDSLRDLSWTPTQVGYLILYDHAGHFADAQPAEFAVALAILQTAVDYWRGAGTPLVVLLRGLENGPGKLSIDPSTL